MRETHVPAQQSQASEDARFPSADAHQGWPCGPQGAPRSGTHPPVGLIRRIQDRGTFAALARAPRHRRGSLSVRFVPAEGPARVAYALGRSVGGAVARNRIRRRLRHAVAAEQAGLRSGAYLFSAGADVMTMPFVELQRRVHELLVAVGSAR